MYQIWNVVLRYLVLGFGQEDSFLNIVVGEVFHMSRSVQNN